MLQVRGVRAFHDTVTNLLMVGISIERGLSQNPSIRLFFWPNSFKYGQIYVQQCNNFQTTGGISERHEMPLTIIFGDRSI